VRLYADGADAVVEIADEGPGMSPSDLALAFEPFFRGERSRSRPTPPVEAHGGTVALTNRPEGGLMARVTLGMRRKTESRV
jgi:two-component system, OmpR family, sensor kinase